jgi:Gas vesicle protein K
MAEEELLAHSPERDELLDALEEKLLSGSPEAGSIAAELERATARLSRRVEADPENVEKGLAQLVLTLIELLRQLMERQAVRRIEAGSLTDDEIDRLGETFMKLEQRMDELKRQFDLRDEDLNLNLGPLGDLL